MEYQIQIADSAAALKSSPVVDENVAVLTQFIPETDLAVGQTHHWRVRAFNDEGQATAWSAVNTMTIADNSPRSSMILVEGGKFTRQVYPAASGNTAADAIDQEVTISSFYIGNYEVTQAEWKDVMGTTPSIFRGDYLPVENISWYDALEYCNKRSEKESLTPVYTLVRDTDGKVTGVSDVDWSAAGYRLPASAEWLYAARGGQQSEGHIYAGSDTLEDVAWYKDNSESSGIADVSKTNEVGGLNHNELKLYDMTGNVTEWCWDYKGTENTDPSITDPVGPSSGTERIVRGGSVLFSAEQALFLRIEAIMSSAPDTASFSTGLRVVQSAPGRTNPVETKMGTVTLESPADTATIHNIYTPGISWSSVSEAAKYQIQIAKSEAALDTSPVVDKEFEGTSYYELTTYPLVFSTTYYWRVRAIGKDSQTGDWSTVYAFTLELEPISDQSPANNAAL